MRVDRIGVLSAKEVNPETQDLSSSKHLECWRKKLLKEEYTTVYFMALLVTQHAFEFDLITCYCESV